jgi:hypothetical protein
MGEASPRWINVKGEGIVKTFFVVLSVKYASSVMSMATSFGTVQGDNKKIDRLIQWNVQNLSSHLVKIVARRADMGEDKIAKAANSDLRLVSSQNRSKGKTCLDEAEDAIALPPFDPNILSKEASLSSVTVDKTVVSQLRSYVKAISEKYHANPFHNSRYHQLRRRLFCRSQRQS